MIKATFAAISGTKVASYDGSQMAFLFFILLVAFDNIPQILPLPKMLPKMIGMVSFINLQVRVNIYIVRLKL